MTDTAELVGWAEVDRLNHSVASVSDQRIDAKGFPMADDTSKTCIECQGTMSPIIVTHTAYGFSNMGAKQLDYHQPDDRRSFWTGKYPSAGQVHAAD